MMRSLLVILLLFSLTSSAQDTSFVKGRIMSKGQGLPGVVVAAVYHHSLLGYGISDSAGYYSLSITHHQKRTLDAASHASVQYIKSGYRKHTIKQAPGKYNSAKEYNIDLKEKRPSSLNIEGKITDAKTNMPIEGAVIMIWNGENLVNACVTDSEGLYSMEAGKEANTMTVDAHGYNSKWMETKGGAAFTLNIDLKPRPKTIRLIDPHEN